MFIDNSEPLAIEGHNFRCQENIDICPEGEWKHEPHRVFFEHAGLPCLVIRMPQTLHLNGYVGFSKDHPLYESELYKDDKVFDSFEVHGGITCSSEMLGHNYFPQGNYLWIGFDCAHAGDLLPYMLIIDPEWGSKLAFMKPEYKNIEFVTNETKRLAEQLRVFGNIQNV